MQGAELVDSAGDRGQPPPDGLVLFDRRDALVAMA